MANESKSSQRMLSRLKDRVRPHIPRLRRTCLECGYLVTNFSTHEMIDDDRRSAGVIPPAAHCYRRIWMREDVEREAKRPRICGSFFPYSDDTASNHRDSHRARSTRRWLIGASLVAPYGAATSAILVGELTRMDGFRVWIGYGLLIGLGIVVLAILGINRIFVRN